jgi:hypothetical protein
MANWQVNQCTFAAEMFHQTQRICMAAEAGKTSKGAPIFNVGE